MLFTAPFRYGKMTHHFIPSVPSTQSYSRGFSHHFFYPCRLRTATIKVPATIPSTLRQFQSKVKVQQSNAAYSITAAALVITAQELAKSKKATEENATTKNGIPSNQS